jgi:hypothetical protein
MTFLIAPTSGLLSYKLVIPRPSSYWDLLSSEGYTIPNWLASFQKRAITRVLGEEESLERIHLQGDLVESLHQVKESKA